MPGRASRSDGDFDVPEFDWPAFASAYALMGAQRASKILGIFARLDKRDGKPVYLAHIPRVKAYLRKNLGHPALAELKAWFDLNLPQIFCRGKDGYGLSAGPDKALVFAAGLGTRMRPITLTVPKPLVRIGGRTMLDHVLDRLAEAGVKEAIVNVHWLADQIEDHLPGIARDVRA